ncbi:MAG TPA: Npt1/Npt2 family nucleotide transporter [Candidatus Krumholzibacteria bacterium]|nr:Npt1/Npt2 family nucleotide transporter [Candidatus Krumholzibacteria bacterium]
MTEPRIARERGFLDRALSPFAAIQAGEGANAVLLTLCVYLLLTAYYVLKVVREPLILAAGGAELKSYTAAAQAVLLLLLIPAYGAVANRVNRVRLISVVSLFFIANLVVFYFLALANTRGLGAAFFVWVGIFNLMIVAQFWSFANDVYTPEQGRRLFGIVGFGQTLGAASGGLIAKLLIGQMHVYTLMLVAAVMLVGYLLLVQVVNRRMQPAGHDAAVAGAPMQDRRGGFALVMKDRYLLLIALLLLLLNVVNTNGEYILGRVVSGQATRLAAAGNTGGLSTDEFVKQFIGRFYADYITWVSVVTALIQILLVSRIMKRFGARVALYVLPVVAMGAYGVLAFVPVLALIRVAKISENSLDYSLNNTARQALFLPTSRDAKYKAKAAIDTFFVRAGDLSSAGLVFLGTLLALQPRDFAIINMVLIVVWLFVVVGIGKRNRWLMEALDAGSIPSD